MVSLTRDEDLIVAPKSIKSKNRDFRGETGQTNVEELNRQIQRENEREEERKQLQTEQMLEAKREEI